MIMKYFIVFLSILSMPLFGQLDKPPNDESKTYQFAKVSFALPELLNFSFQMKTNKMRYELGVSPFWLSGNLHFGYTFFEMKNLELYIGAGAGVSFLVPAIYLYPGGGLTFKLFENHYMYCEYAYGFVPILDGDFLEIPAFRVGYQLKIN